MKKAQGCDNLLGWSTPRRRSCGVFVWSNRPVETEEDRSGVGFRPFARVGLDGDDEGRADYGENTSLGTWSALCSDRGNAETHENRGSVKIFIALFHVLGIVLWSLVCTWCGNQFMEPPGHHLGLAC